jgi:hypothetical protein
MSIVFESGITVESGVTITSPGFTLSPSDFGSYYSGSVTVNGTTGFTNNDGTHGPGWSFYGPLLGTTQGGNPTKIQEIYNYWVNNGLLFSSSGASYIFNASWGPGSSPTSDKVVMSLYVPNHPVLDNAVLDIGPVYTGNNNWQTGGQDIYNATLKAATGTYNLPATFTLYSPKTQDNSNWC